MSLRPVQRPPQVRPPEVLLAALTSLRKACTVLGWVGTTLWIVEAATPARLHHTIEAAGGRAASTHYTSDSSMGGLGGVSRGAVTDNVVYHGYVGQLNEPPLARPDLIVRNGHRLTKVTAAQLLANDLDPEGSRLHLAGVAPFSRKGVPLTLRRDRVEADDNLIGDSFVYQVSDEIGMLATGTASIDFEEPTAPVWLHVEPVSGTAYQRLSFQGQPGKSYWVEATEKLDGRKWTRLIEVMAPPNGVCQFVDPEAARHPQRFYRVSY